MKTRTEYIYKPTCWGLNNNQMKDAIKHIEHFITELLFRQCILLKSGQSFCLFLGGFYSLQHCQSKASLKFSAQDRTHTKRTSSSEKIFASSSPGRWQILNKSHKLQKLSTTWRVPDTEHRYASHHRRPFPAVQTFPGRKLRIEASLPISIQRKLFFLLPRLSVKILSI